MAVASWALSFQSITPINVLLTNWMMLGPPGEPVAIRKSPLEPSLALANTMVGAIELRGRLFGSILFAIGAPWPSVGFGEKSVN